MHELRSDEHPEGAEAENESQADEDRPTLKPILRGKVTKNIYRCDK
jgi:hypothetical protein